MNQVFPKKVFNVNCDFCGYTFHSKNHLKIYLTKLMDSLNGNIANPFFMLIVMFVGWNPRKPMQNKPMNWKPTVE